MGLSSAANGAYFSKALANSRVGEERFLGSLDGENRTVRILPDTSKTCFRVARGGLLVAMALPIAFMRV